MRLIYCYHIILISLLAPFSIGASYSLWQGNFTMFIVAGVSIVVYSLIVTLPLSLITLVGWKFFDYSLSKLVCVSLGLFFGVILGCGLSAILKDSDYIFLIISIIVGPIVGYVEWKIFARSE